MGWGGGVSDEEQTVKAVGVTQEGVEERNCCMRIMWTRRVSGSKGGVISEYSSS